MNNDDDLMRQLLAAAFMCGETIPARNSEIAPDPLQQFCSADKRWVLFNKALTAGYIEAFVYHHYVITQKGKDFFYGNDPLLLTQEPQKCTVIDSQEEGDTC